MRIETPRCRRSEHDLPTSPPAQGFLCVRVNIRWIEPQLKPPAQRPHTHLPVCATRNAKCCAPQSFVWCCTKQGGDTVDNGKHDKTILKGYRKRFQGEIATNTRFAILSPSTLISCCIGLVFGGCMRSLVLNALWFIAADLHWGRSIA